MSKKSNQLTFTYQEEINKRTIQKMIFEADKFTFQPVKEITRARRILIKPYACTPLPYPYTTSLQTLELIIQAIRRVSDADVLLLESSPVGDSMRTIYKILEYNFPRVLMLDVRECNFVEVENPLPKAFAIPTFWLPNVLLSCDYLISVAPFRVVGKRGVFTIENLLGLLPISKYGSLPEPGLTQLQAVGLQRVIADLYFTIPFDLGIIDGQKRLICTTDPNEGIIEELNKIFIGEPFEVDREASRAIGLETDYLKLIDSTRNETVKKES